MEDDDYKNPQLYSWLKSFIEGKDYKWGIARGDSHPHAIEIFNSALLKDPSFKEWYSEFNGKSPY